MQTQANNFLNPHRYYLSHEAKKRLRWLYLLYYECGGSVTRAANRVGVSRQWLSTIKGIFEKHGKNPRSLEPLSKAPHNTDNRSRIPKEVEETIITVRDTYSPWGKVKIAHILKRDYSITVSASTVNRYLSKHGKINPSISQKNKTAWQNKKLREQTEPPLKVKHRPPKQIKDYKPGALIEKDMKFVLKQGINNNTDKYRAKENFSYQHTEIDSFTRIRTLELVETSDSAAARQAHRQAVKRFPFPIATCNTDNGGENEKEFSQELRDKIVFQFYSSVGTPTDNPRVERSHRTDEEEFYSQGNRYKSFEEQQETMKKWEYTYNYIRPHQALGYLTPIEFYQLWKKNPEEAHCIKDEYQKYLQKQQKRLATARRIKKKEQIEALMQFIDAKLSKKRRLNEYKKSLINCHLCS